VYSLSFALQRTARILTQVGGEKEYLVIGFEEFRRDTFHRTPPAGGC
jgi:hypothetical protein